jgi:hypothetical protein
MCDSINDVDMNVVMDPEDRYYLRPVLYSSGQRDAAVENTRLRASPYTLQSFFSEAVGELHSSTGTHSLHFQNAYPRCKLTDGIRLFLQRPRNSH